jgi:polysaccharide pyruvyl transferase CsaB
MGIMLEGLGILAKKIKIVISGYYGFGNSGDEAVLQSMLIALKEHGMRNNLNYDPIVISNNPTLTEAMYHVKAFHRMKITALFRTILKSDGLISGGGSLLQDVTSKRTVPYYLLMIFIAQLLRKPTFIYSQGIGPIKTKLFFKLIQNVFNRCTYISVRDHDSRDLLRQMGVRKNIEVVSDPVMGIPVVETGEETGSSLPHDNKMIIGVSVRYWTSDRSELKILAKSLEYIMLEKQIRIIFLPFHAPSDTDASQYVMNLIDSKYHHLIKIAETTVNPIDMIRNVTKCDLIIGMRLHSLIYATSQKIACVGISYDPKIDIFLRSIRAEPSASTTNFDFETFTNEISERLVQNKQWILTRSQLIDEIKIEAQKPAQYISNYYRDLLEKNKKNKINEVDDIGKPYII